MFNQAIRTKANEIKGSMWFGVRPYGSTEAFTSVGALSGFKVNRKKDTVKIERDNTSTDIELGEIGAEISFTWFELGNTYVASAMAGEAYTFTAGTSTTLSQTFTATDDYAYPINAINADGSAPTVTSCKVGGVDYTDYKIVKVGGAWLIAFNATGVYTVVFSYTPIATATCYSGDETELPYFEAMSINTSENGVNEETFYKCILTSGLDIDYQKDSGSDRAARTAVKITCMPDANHTAPNGNYRVSKRVKR